jgi:hypothetical protein
MPRHAPLLSLFELSSKIASDVYLMYDGWGPQKCLYGTIGGADALGRYRGSAQRVAPSTACVVRTFWDELPPSG